MDDSHTTLAAQIEALAAKAMYRKTALVEAEQFLPNEGKIPAGVYSNERADPRKNPLADWMLNTLEGPHVLRNGDYICTGPAGERWNVSQEIFEATYERVAAPAIVTALRQAEGGAEEVAAYQSDVLWWLEIAEGKGYGGITEALEAAPSSRQAEAESRVEVIRTAKIAFTDEQLAYLNSRAAAAKNSSPRKLLLHDIERTVAAVLADGLEPHRAGLEAAHDALSSAIGWPGLGIGRQAEAAPGVAEALRTAEI